MPVTIAQLQNAAELKRKLVEYALSEEIADDLRPAMARYQVEHDLGPDEIDQNVWSDFLDTFIHHHTFSDGTGLIDNFLAKDEVLTEDEREIVGKWRDCTEGVFHIERRADDSLITHNLIDELPYSLRSNQAGGTRQYIPGSYMLTRVVPLHDEWMLSGSALLLPARDARDAYQTALHYATTQPELVFRNPALRERAWESQKKQRELFIELFGADCLIIAPEEYEPSVRKYQYYIAKETATDDAHETALREGAEALPVEKPEWIDDVDTIGFVYDERGGAMTLPDYGLLIDTLKNPELAATSPNRDVVLEYVEEDDIPSLAFRRLADADPASATRALQLAYEDPDLTWEKDGERLLRDNRGRDDTPTQPTVVVISDLLVRFALGEEPPQPPTHKGLVGRNDPCPCGSGQKYKRCCGK